MKYVTGKNKKTDTIQQNNFKSSAQNIQETASWSSLSSSVFNRVPVERLPCKGNRQTNIRIRQIISERQIAKHDQNLRNGWRNAAETVTVKFLPDFPTQQSCLTMEKFSGIRFWSYCRFLCATRQTVGMLVGIFFIAV